MQPRKGTLGNLVSPTATLLIKRIDFEDLPAVNTFTSGSDPYCKVYYQSVLDILFQTKHIKGVTEGSWEVNRSFTLKFELRNFPHLNFLVYDWNRIAAHQQMGIGALKVAELRLGSNFIDVNLYPGILRVYYELQCKELEDLEMSWKREQEAAEAKVKSTEDALTKFDSQLAQLLINPAENVTIDLFNPDIKVPQDKLFACARTFIQKVPITDVTSNNQTVMDGYGCAILCNAVNVSTMLPSSALLLKNMLQTTKWKNAVEDLIYDYLSPKMDLTKFRKVDSNFMQVFEFGCAEENIRKLAGILFTQDPGFVEKIKNELELKGNSCQLLSTCLNEATQSKNVIAIQCVMEAMMWCYTYHEVQQTKQTSQDIMKRTLVERDTPELIEFSIEFSTQNVLTELWSKVPEMLLKTYDPKNEILIELMKGRGGEFVEIMRIMSRRFFSIDAKTCDALNALFVTGLYKSDKVRLAFKVKA